MSIAAPSVKDQKLLSLGLVESASVNSFADFKPANLAESQVTNEKDINKEKEDFNNILICHLIFYAFLCISIVLHILIDLGFGSFIKNQFVHLIGLGKKLFSRKPLLLPN